MDMKNSKTSTCRILSDFPESIFRSFLVVRPSYSLLFPILPVSSLSGIVLLVEKVLTFN